MQAFNGKKWEKFNSEKVASLAYGRIQGKVALITHFQNSSLMNEDKWCRPILFQSEDQEDDNQVLCLQKNCNLTSNKCLTIDQRSKMANTRGAVGLVIRQIINFVCSLMIN